MLLQIKNLKASIKNSDAEPILKGLNLEVKPNEIHAIMGPNGSGKSTLSKIIAGHPDYEVIEGEILFNGQNLLDLEVTERANAGIFLGFQYPIEVPGVNNADFLRLAYNSKQVFEGKEELDPLDFNELLENKIKLLNIPPYFIERSLNEGFSGGEKKRNEILQMAILEPILSILDEIDSGLDIDALKLVSESINKLRNPDKALILITHYQRLLDYIEPTHVHIMYQGLIVKSGGAELALELEKNGYAGAVN
jgi:Fe-S cluster assembly ATP-binding protein